MRIYRSMLGIIVLLLLSGCGSGGTAIIIGSIQGPLIITEYTSASYTTNVSDAATSEFLWTVNPPDRVRIANNALQTITIQTDGVASDTVVELSVQVKSAEGDIETSTIEIQIEDRPDSWTRTIGGSGYDRATGVTADSTGNIYITGYFSNVVDFDPGLSEELRTSIGREDAYLAKFSPGGDFIRVKTWGGPGIESGNVVEVDVDGNVVVAGWSQYDVDFDPGPGELKFDWLGANDLFASKFDPLGNLIWAKAWGGSAWDIIHGMTTSPDGSIYLGIEFFETVDFDPAAAGVDEHVSVGHADIALCKLDRSGNFQWAHSWGSVAGDGADGLVFDDDGNLYMTGDFSFTIDFDPGPGVDELTSNGERDVFLMKWNANDEYQWTRSWGSSGPTVESWDKGNGIDVDFVGNPVVTGMFKGTVDFDAGPAEFILNSAGEADIFTCKYDPAGNFLWAYRMGGPGYDIGIEVQADSSGNVYTVGVFKDTADFDSGPGSPTFVSNGYHDSCVTCIDQYGNHEWTAVWGGEGADYAHNIFVTELNELLITGSMRNENDFGNPGEHDVRKSNGKSDIFVRKLQPSAYVSQE